ncbi:MAG: hypothetical protein QOF51_4164 [Chloroflexota bacterium]|jgi:hypothetical protein|nr:hypothetical protein [Chloroflexota bacterium]
MLRGLKVATPPAATVASTARVGAVHAAGALLSVAVAGTAVWSPAVGVPAPVTVNGALTVTLPPPGAWPSAVMV